MMNRHIKQAAFWGLGLVALAGADPAAFAQEQQSGPPSPVGRNSMMAATPFTDFTIGAMIYVLLVGALVVTLLGGGMLILNLGLLSKREEDKVGSRNPSDVGILKGQIWPQEPDRSPVLPAEDEESDRVVASLSERAKDRWKAGKRPAA